jgi:hypothetical protein
LQQGAPGLTLAHNLLREGVLRYTRTLREQGIHKILGIEA